MKKIFSFFAMAAFMTFMVACGGNDNESKENKDNGNKDNAQNEVVENEAIQEGSNVENAIRMTEDMLDIMQQEPSVEAFENMMMMTKKLDELSTKLTKEEEAEVEKYVMEHHPEMMNPQSMDEKTQEMRMKWENWAMEHQEEAQEIAKKVSEMK